MPKGSLTKEKRNWRYNELRAVGASRDVAKRAMDYSLENYIILWQKCCRQIDRERAKQR